jgi:Fe(3+) dicitrate transport protein
MKNSDVQKIQGYFIMDAAATVRIHKSVELTANLLNLTNKVYIAALHPYGYRPGMPFNFNGGIRFRF